VRWVDEFIQFASFSVCESALGSSWYRLIVSRMGRTRLRPRRTRCLAVIWRSIPDQVRPRKIDLQIGSPGEPLILEIGLHLASSKSVRTGFSRWFSHKICPDWVI
jgi:hypothetical protein